jgi:hypothetical protein
MPRLLNIWREKRGNPAPTIDLRNVLAAMADAALEMVSSED